MQLCYIGPYKAAQIWNLLKQITQQTKVSEKFCASKSMMG